MRPALHRLVTAIVGSPVVPVSQRVRLLPRLGYRIGARLRMHAGAHLGSSRIRFGDDVYVNVGLFYDGDGDVTVGSAVAIGPQVRLITATHEIGPPDRRCGRGAMSRPIVIEDGCWLAAGVTVLPGVRVARGCVIAAGAVVSRSTAPDGLYAGVPARRVRDLPGGGSGARDREPRPGQTYTRT